MVDVRFLLICFLCPENIRAEEMNNVRNVSSIVRGRVGFGALPADRVRDLLKHNGLFLFLSVWDWILAPCSYVAHNGAIRLACFNICINVLTQLWLTQLFYSVHKLSEFLSVWGKDIYSSRICLLLLQDEHFSSSPLFLLISYHKFLDLVVTITITDFLFRDVKLFY